MNPIPVLTSTISAEYLARILQEKYGFGTTCTCRLFRAGINHTYMVQAGEEKYVLRVYSHNWRSETEIREEIRLLNLLHEHQVSVSFPLVDLTKNYIQTLDAPEGLRYAVLFTYAEGEKIRNLTPITCQNIGRLMAKMHQVTLEQPIDRIAYNAHTLTQLPYHYATAYFPESMPEMMFVQNAGKFLTSHFQQADATSLRKGIVHLDMWYDNMNIENESTITIFDFDFCGCGWLVLDIAYFSMQLFHTEPDKTQFELKLEAFLKGYEQVTPIAEEERRMIPYAGLAIWIFYLGVQSQRFDNWSNIFLTNNYLKHYIGLVKGWLAYHTIELPIAE